jgi:hypothetical protein
MPPSEGRGGDAGFRVCVPASPREGNLPSEGESPDEYDTTPNRAPASHRTGALENDAVR